MKKETLRLLFFALFSIVIFFGGVFFTQYPVIIIPIVIFAFYYLLKDYMKTSKEISKKIEGEGITKITASDKDAPNPKGRQEGELWIKYKK